MVKLSQCKILARKVKVSEKPNFREIYFNRKLNDSEASYTYYVSYNPIESSPPLF